MRYEILEWDTEFFGMKVARITELVRNEAELTDILLSLKASSTALVYWPSDRIVNQDTISRLGGKLVDSKMTFAIDFRVFPVEEYVSSNIIEQYTSSMCNKELESLAIQSGEYSRFAKDTNIPQDKFFALYKIWIDRSIRKEIAEEVLAIREGERIVGLITLGNKNGRGDIGLLAVDRNYRGKRYGEKLVQAAQRWFVDNGYRCGQVITQGANIQACNLYKKCGYSIENVEYFYHFWPQHVS